ncbi:hypothetical protein [Nocardia sp. NRRL WC-3656]|uniref:hypothetical protein n=1 Tax=Nocardia sp. NRRL WC-3656 TaxID=1463824 RepID=UPI0018CC5913|nr:hypothetical protein [Nocardia sp. NRRL WC-3656]
MSVQQNSHTTVGADGSVPAVDVSYIPEDMTPPTVEAIEAGRQAQVELAQIQGNPEVSAEAKWWGFRVFLNHEAVNLSAEIYPRIATLVGQFLPAPIGTIVGAYCKAHSVIMKRVDKGRGVVLTSPWVAIAALVPTPMGWPSTDTSLWWTVFEEEHGWSQDEEFPKHASEANPALAAFEGKLFCVHRGGGSDKSLWQTLYDPDTGWSEDRRFAQHASDAGPALAVFDGALHCVHKGNGTVDSWWTKKTSSTGTWSQDQVIARHATDAGPALAVFKNKLYCVRRGSGSDKNLWWSTLASSSSNWSRDAAIPGAASDSNPALAVFRDSSGVEKLYCVHKGNGSDKSLWYTTTTDGQNWSADRKFPNHGTNAGPALAVFKNKLYCVHRGNRDQSLWWTRLDSHNSTWTPDRELSQHASHAGPALIVYRDKNSTKDQLMCVHRGYGPKKATPDGDPSAVDAT